MSSDNDLMDSDLLGPNRISAREGVAIRAEEWAL